MPGGSNASRITLAYNAQHKSVIPDASPNARQWKKVCVGHVDFMLFVYFFPTLGSLRECSFWWNKFAVHSSFKNFFPWHLYELAWCFRCALKEYWPLRSTYSVCDIVMGHATLAIYQSYELSRVWIFKNQHQHGTPPPPPTPSDIMRTDFRYHY